VINEMVWHICLPVPSEVTEAVLNAVSCAAEAEGSHKTSASATTARINAFMRQRFVLPPAPVKPNLIRYRVARWAVTLPSSAPVTIFPRNYHCRPARFALAVNQT
jgi:hypothetical protein